jgi:RNA polymerase sigma-70 factor (ECF subfamily)
MSEAEETRFRHDLAALLPRVRRFALALTGAVADADDLTQAALERALVRQRQFTPGTRLDSWVFRIAQNLWIDQMRSRRSRGTHVELDEAAGAFAAHKDEHEMAADRIDIVRTIATLPEEQRVVVGLVLVEGWSYQEAADMLETPIGTVMSRLSRARERIKAALDVDPVDGGAR